MHPQILLHPAGRRFAEEQCLPGLQFQVTAPRAPGLRGEAGTLTRQPQCPPGREGATFPSGVSAQNQGGLPSPWPLGDPMRFSQLAVRGRDPAEGSRSQLAVRPRDQGLLKRLVPWF